MAATVRSFAYTADSTANPHLAAKPAGLEVGDLIVLLASGWQTTPYAPAGFTTQRESVDGNDHFSLFTKVAAAADVAGSSFSVGNEYGSRHIASCTYAVTGGAIGVAGGTNAVGEGTVFSFAVANYVPAANDSLVFWGARLGAQVASYNVNGASQTTATDRADDEMGTVRFSHGTWVSGTVTSIGLTTGSASGVCTMAAIMVVESAGGGTVPRRSIGSGIGSGIASGIA